MRKSSSGLYDARVAALEDIVIVSTVGSHPALVGTHPPLERTHPALEGPHPPLAGVHSWHIPRPSLIPDSDSESRSQTQRGSASSQGSSSNTSTQSGASGSLLLTAANLASLRCEPHLHRPPYDTASLASSTHFTVVNGVERRRAKPLPSCCCKKHQLHVLVLAMSTIFFVAILLAVLYLEMRWRDIHLFT